MSRLVLAIGSAGLIALGALAAVAPARKSVGASPAVLHDADAYKPVIDTHDLMEAVAESFERLQNGAKEGAKALKVVRKEAFLLAELANVLPHFKSEEVKGEAKQKKWGTIATSIRDDLLKIAAHAKKKEIEPVAKILTRIEATCESCHDMREDA
jgi:cytochrome c556